MSVRQELLDLREKDGSIHAERVVEFARTYKKSSLHARFRTWDVGKAAYEFWLMEARRIITLEIGIGSTDPIVVNLKFDRNKGGGYRPLSGVFGSTELTDILFREALEDLNRVKDKYHAIKRLSLVWDKIEEANRQAKTDTPMPQLPARRRGKEGAAKQMR